ncbi:13294_t:CDS:1, partial [Funneliformis geosporum]
EYSEFQDTFHKVNAYTRNFSDDTADFLAKAGCDLPSLFP